MVDMKSLFKYMLFMTEVSKLINTVEEKFGELKLENVSGNQFSIIILNNQGYSIGHLFGYLD